MSKFYGGGGVESGHAKAGKRWIGLEAQQVEILVEGSGALYGADPGCAWVQIPSSQSSDPPVNSSHSRSNALPASTLSQMSSTSGQATASRCETEFSVPVAAHGATSPAPGSALADDSPNVLSGRDRGFYYDPPDEDDYAEGFSHKYGVLQC